MDQESLGWMVRQQSELTLPRGGPMNWHIHRHFGLILWGRRTVLQLKLFCLIDRFQIKNWDFCTSGILHCVVGYFLPFRRNLSLPSSRNYRGPCTLKYAGSTFLRNVGKHLLHCAVPHLRGIGILDYTSTLYVWYIVSILMFNAISTRRQRLLLLKKKFHRDYVNCLTKHFGIV
jgi:hypothetical protein